MKIAVTALLLASLTAAGANDVLQTMKVSPKDAAQETVQSLVHGNVNTWRVRNVFKNASPSLRASLVEQTLLWTKAYVSSPQFAKDYAVYREEARPRPEERKTTVDQELAARKKQRDADLAEGKANVAKMPAEYRKMAEEGYKALAESMKQMDTPEFRKMERMGIENERRQQDERHAERVAQWEKEFPADSRMLVKSRLQELLRDTADVDFAATLKGRQFANATYERKPQEWKLAYRAGKEPTDPQIEQMGAFNNAFTAYDITYYFPLTFTSNLRKLAELEGARFRGLRYSERIFRTEAGAVFGEYRRIASDPGLKMEEVLGDLMYGPAHGYGHSGIGYLDDVKDMPNAYKSALKFYDDYYRPNNTVIVVAGDVKAAEVFSEVEKNFAEWKSKKTPEQPDPKPLAGPRKQHETWPADIPPRVIVSYMVPPYAPGSPEGAVMDVMAEIMGGETSPTFKKLRYEDQTASQMFVDNNSSRGFDARPLATYLQVAKEKYDVEGRPLLDRVEGDVARGFEALASFSTQPDAAKRLQSIQSQLRYDILAGLNSPANIAQTYGEFYRFSRDPQVLEKVAAAIASLKPTDIDAFAKKYFTPKNRVSVTLAGGAQ